MFKNITKTVWVLSVVSLFTDTASEMLYPILPVYLKSIGFSILLIGILEGIAEATAGLSKGYFGKLSDIQQKRAPFVQVGYLLSTLAKPMMAMLVFPLWIFFARTLDRFGKGLRTGARDAILSDEATPETKGEVFGFHRAMDTAGAVLGPLLALWYLYVYPEDYVTLFYVAFIPGMLAVATSLLIKDKKPNILVSREKTPKVHFLSFLTYWKSSSKSYRSLLIGLLGFALFNSSDVFLLLMAKEAGYSDSLV
ncbi:MAG: MFS family permease, partial [Bacteroidia bacterium]